MRKVKERKRGGAAGPVSDAQFGLLCGGTLAATRNAGECVAFMKAPGNDNLGNCDLEAKAVATALLPGIVLVFADSVMDLLWHRTSVHWLHALLRDVLDPTSAIPKEVTE